MKLNELKSIIKEIIREEGEEEGDKTVEDFLAILINLNVAPTSKKSLYHATQDDYEPDQAMELLMDLGYLEPSNLEHLANAKKAIKQIFRGLEPRERVWEERRKKGRNKMKINELKKLICREMAHHQQKTKTKKEQLSSSAAMLKSLPGDNSNIKTSSIKKELKLQKESTNLLNSINTLRNRVLGSIYAMWPTKERLGYVHAHGYSDELKEAYRILKQIEPLAQEYSNLVAKVTERE